MQFRVPVLTALFLVFVASGCLATARDSELAGAKALTPALPPLEAPPVPTQLVVLPLRVYVTPAYQRETLTWRASVDKQVEAANVRLRTVGGELRVQSVDEWDAEIDDLAKGLGELAAEDDAGDGAFVLGLVGALGVFSDDHDNLGRANVLGRHMIVRAMNERLEMEALRGSFKHLEEDQLSELTRERIGHKISLVLIHEVAHNLGALHVEDIDGLMFGSHHVTQTGFLPTTALLLTRMIALYGRFSGDFKRWEIEARLELETHLADPDHRAGLVGATVAKTRAWLAGPPGKRRKSSVRTGPGRLVEGLNLVQTSSYDDALTKLQAGKAQKAWEVIDPLTRDAPKSVHVAELACSVASQLDDPAPAVSACRRASTMSDSGTPTVMHADALRRQGEEVRARAVLVGGTLVLTHGGNREDLTYAAEMLLGMNYLTDAEDAARRALPQRRAQELLDTIGDARRMYGLRRGLVPADDEAAALTLIRTAVKSSDPKPWADAARTFAARYGDHAPAHYLRCGAELNLGRVKAAEEACNKALEQDADCAYAHTLLGHLSAGRGKKDEALQHLSKAIELSPGRRYPYLVLARMLRRYGDKVRLRALDAKFHDRFGEDLP